MKILGIDPGKDGAAVAVDSETREVLLQVRATDHYVSSDGEYIPRHMYLLLQSVPLDLVVLERQHAMPAQGRTSCLTIGVGFGLWWMAVAAQNIPLERFSAVTWQKLVLKGVPGEGKARAARAAEEKLRGLTLYSGRSKKPHSGLADAACLALAGIEKAGGRS